MDYLGLIPSQDLISGKVSDKMGDEYGHIKELIVDPATGKIVLAVVSNGGILGISATNKILPWQALQMNPNTHDFQLIVDRETYDKSPNLTAEDYGDRNALKELFTYYGYTPYWEDAQREDSIDFTYRNTEQNQHHAHQEFEGSHQEIHDTLSHNSNNNLGGEADFDKIIGTSQSRSPLGGASQSGL